MKALKEDKKERRFRRFKGKSSPEAFPLVG